MSISSELIVARDVELVFAGRHAALRDVQLEIPRQEFVCIVGPSGCGKSTLLRLVAGLLAPTAGQVTLDAAPAFPVRRESQRVGFVFQDPALLPWRSAWENVALPLELAGVQRGEAEKRVRQCLQLVNLREEDWNKHPRALSGGMRMRVSLARAIVTSPDIMLLDEPFAALDDLLRTQLNEELLRLWQLRQWTAMFVTHNVAEAVFLGGRVLVMSPAPGRVVREFFVPFDYPRAAELRARPEFARLTGEIAAALREAHA